MLSPLTTHVAAETLAPLVQPGLVLTPLHATTHADAIRQLGEHLQAAGYVTPAWIDATLESEQIFPSGLPTEIPVAVPHTDARHVNASAIAIGILSQPVPFREMGHPQYKQPVQIVCALAITPAQQVVIVLQHLVATLQKPNLLAELVASKSPIHVAALLNHHLAHG